MPKTATIDVAPYLMFRCGAICAVLPLAEVRETLRPLPVVALESAPRFVRGMSVIRGMTSVIVDGACLLSGDEAAPVSTSDSARFIVLRVAERPVALAVDSVVGVRDLTSDTIEALPPLVAGEEGGPAEQLAHLDGEVWMLLRTGRLASNVADVDVTAVRHSP